MNPLVRLWYLVEFAVATSLFALFAILPLRFMLGLGRMVARLGFALMGGRRAVAIENILRSGLVRDRPAARQMARASFCSFVAMVIEANIARRRLTTENWPRHVKLVMSTEAETLLRRPGQGIILASAHFGNWEVAGRALSMLKPLWAIYRPFTNPYLDRAAQAGRSATQLHLISKFDDNPMRFAQTLARGESFGILIDQYAGRSGVLVDFFGRPAWTTKTAALLHLITRMPLLIGFALRTGPLQYELHAVGPFAHARSGDREKDVIAITQSLTSEIEKVVRAHPEQYMWGHRRWKNTEHAVTATPAAAVVGGH